MDAPINSLSLGGERVGVRVDFSRLSAIFESQNPASSLRTLLSVEGEVVKINQQTGEVGGVCISGKPDGHGARRITVDPPLPGVFQTVQRVDDFPLVCDAQIYLDLIRAGLRGDDQAKALRGWKGFCKS
ncbi:MAG: hypothetical protein WCO77_08560 [bacterium]